MSLTNVWKDRAIERRHDATLKQLRRAAFESQPTERIQHIHVKSTRNHLGGVTPFGANSPACSAAFEGMSILEVHPYMPAVMKVCSLCVKRVQSAGIAL